MRYLTLAEVLSLHSSILDQSGGAEGVRDLGALESAVAQPRMTVAGEDASASIEEKAAALCFSLATNHPCVDGNKRVAHAAMEVFLILNGLEISSNVDEQEQVMLDLAAGTMERDALRKWLARVVRRIGAESH